MSQTRCVASTVPRSRERAYRTPSRRFPPAQGQGRVSCPRWNTGLPPCTLRGRVLCESSPPPCQGCGSTVGIGGSQLEAIAVAGCDCYSRRLWDLGGVFPPRVLGGTPGSWGGRVFQQTCFHGASTTSAPTSSGVRARLGCSLGLSVFSFWLGWRVRKCVT